MSLWECIDKMDGECTRRLKVPGGWLVKVYAWEEGTSGFAPAMAMTFVPDKAHLWKVD